MKTELNNANSQANTEQRAEQRSGNWKSGVSSSVGAAAGVVGGFAAQSAFAGESSSEEIQPQVVSASQESSPIEQPQETEERPEDSSVSQPESSSETIVTPSSTPEVAPEATQEITVVSYQTVANEDGSQMDVAQVLIDDQPALVVDVDLDGQADVLVVDVDGDRMITENDLIDVSQANIRMNDLEELAVHASEEATDPACNSGNLMADMDSLPDYTNDADVSVYMA